MAVLKRNSNGALSAASQLGDPRLFFRDMRVALALLNDARYRTLARLLGVPRDQANLVTAVILLTLADRARESTQRVLRAPAAPSFAEGLVGGSIVRDALCSIAGPAARDTPLLGTLLTIAVLGRAGRVALQKSARTMDYHSRRLSRDFHHRYGYLVDPGHLRARRASRSEAGAAGAGDAR